ncbi:MAG: hypothetical protein N2690_05030 [Rhodocyclaceae bacterium]|nr:hypothetical protein [Rhodocyclaceae bacterium]
MPVAVCPTCGLRHYWKARRGEDKRPRTCSCGAALQPARKQQAPEPSLRMACAICGLRPAGLRTLTQDHVAIYSRTLYPAGTAVCWQHLKLLQPINEAWLAQQRAVTLRRALAQALQRIQACGDEDQRALAARLERALLQPLSIDEMELWLELLRQEHA